MKRSWNKRRAIVESQDAQRRWDRAYQLLMQWSSCDEDRAIASDCHKKEKNNENSDLCASINTKTDTAAEY